MIARGIAQVKIPMMANADAVEIKAVNHEGEEIMTWSRGVKSEERSVKNSSAPSTSSASSAAYADQADAVEVKAGGRTYRFAKKDGRLMGVEVGSKAISLSNGPRFMAARRSDRSLDQFYNHDDKEAEKEARKQERREKRQAWLAGVKEKWHAWVEKIKEKWHAFLAKFKKEE